MKTRTNSAVWLEKYERWQIKVTNDDGVRKTFTSPTPGKKGQTECNRKADEWLLSGLRSPETRCSTLIDAWLEDMRKHTKAVTIDGEATQNAHYEKTACIAKVWIEPNIGMKRIGKLRRVDLQEVLDDAFITGRSKKTIQNIRGAMSLYLKWCRLRDLTRLTTDDLEVPKNAKVGEREILQPEDLKKLFSCSDTEWRGKVQPAWYIHAWRFSVVMGLRPGELYALERKHIAGDRILVRGAINFRGIKTSGKNENAIRDIVLNPLAKEILADQASMLKAAGVVSKYIFPAPGGDIVSQDTAAKNWKRYREHNGIQKTTPYELRHTYVSVVSGRSDLSIGDLRRTVGHSQNMDTLGTYSHRLTAEENRIAAQIDSVYRDLLGTLPKTQK